MLVVSIIMYWSLLSAGDERQARDTVSAHLWCSTNLQFERPLPCYTATLLVTPHPRQEQIYSGTTHTHLCEWITAGELSQCHIDSLECQPHQQVNSFGPQNCTISHVYLIFPPTITGHHFYSSYFGCKWWWVPPKNLTHEKNKHYFINVAQ